MFPQKSAPRTSSKWPARMVWTHRLLELELQISPELSNHTQFSQQMITLPELDYFPIFLESPKDSSTLREQEVNLRTQ